MEQPDAAGQLREPAPSLTIHLRYGFQGDLLIIKVNGKEVYRNEDLVTDHTVGFADSKTIALPAGKASIEILMPRRKLKARHALVVDKPLYLLVSLIKDALQVRVSDEEPMYF